MKIATPVNLFKLVSLPIFIFMLISFPASAQENCKVIKDYKRCDIALDSAALKTTIPVFIFLPHFNDPTLEREYIEEAHSVLFLHGRGYARQMNEPGSMLEHADLNQVFKTLQSPMIFIAPQDIVVQDDNQKIGNDYWLGNGSRDWDTFLSHELPESLSHLNLNSERLSVLGISMGAHGALMLGSKHPELISHTLSLSPIFRSSFDEIPEMDRDIFLQKGLEKLEEFSFGTKLLNQTAQLPKSLYVEIDYRDFGLDLNQFPNSVDVWGRLIHESFKHPGQRVKIVQEGSGHSMKYWKTAIKDALSWLSIQENKL
ncbi:MAG: hypothetical protein CME63_16155 [Halobacteriovoraceae bacterium]|nr:hypothetical protein [Halobacteriovoraceae bacterium]MBC99277.1 hypothetical protein [Halobacteriovoraceae bacterium]|tara:strand:- start:75877 stop:76818 length:942 start_codon:yes stop_codon:yes gene_type:complete